jgi:hypothetical protein
VLSLKIGGLNKTYRKIQAQQRALPIFYIYRAEEQVSVWYNQKA